MTARHDQFGILPQQSRGISEHTHRTLYQIRHYLTHGYNIQPTFFTDKEAIWNCTQSMRAFVSVSVNTYTIAQPHTHKLENAKLLACRRTYVRYADCTCHDSEVNLAHAHVYGLCLHWVTAASQLEPLQNSDETLQLRDSHYTMPHAAYVRQVKLTYQGPRHIHQGHALK